MGIPGLDLFLAGNEAQQGGFTDTVGTDEPDLAPCRDLKIDGIEGEFLSIAMI